MRIFCDETGKFITESGYPQQDVFPSVCAIVFTNQGEREWDRYSSTLMKGSKIKNDQAEELIDVLVDLGARAFLVSTNFQHVSEKTIEDERTGYILSAETACKNHPQHLQNAVAAHGAILRDLTLPDYVKAKLIIKLLENTIRGMVGNTRLYSDEDLALFTWYCDPVSIKIHRTVSYYVQYQMNCYSHRDPFYVEEIGRLTPFINEVGSVKHLDTSKVLQGINFISDNESPGIKAADCIANFFPRLIRGTLRLNKLGGLMKLFSLPYSFECVHFDPEKSVIDIPVTFEGGSVLDAIQDAEKWGRVVQFLTQNPTHH